MKESISILWPYRAVYSLLYRPDHLGNLWVQTQKQIGHNSLRMNTIFVIYNYSTLIKYL